MRSTALGLVVLSVLVLMLVLRRKRKLSLQLQEGTILIGTPVVLSSRMQVGQELIAISEGMNQDKYSVLLITPDKNCKFLFSEPVKTGTVLKLTSALSAQTTFLVTSKIYPFGQKLSVVSRTPSSVTLSDGLTWPLQGLPVSNCYEVLPLGEKQLITCVSASTTTFHPTGQGFQLVFDFSNYFKRQGVNVDLPVQRQLLVTLSGSFISSSRVSGKSLKDPYQTNIITIPFRKLPGAIDPARKFYNWWMYGIGVKGSKNGKVFFDITKGFQATDLIQCDTIVVDCPQDVSVQYVILPGKLITVRSNTSGSLPFI